MQSAQFNFDAVVARAEQSRAGSRPTVNLAASASRAQTAYSPGNDRDDGSRSFSVSASQPLYRPVNSLNMAQSEELVESAAAALEAARQDLAMRVAQAYFDVLAAGDTLDLLTAQKQAATEQEAAARQGFSVGTVTLTDGMEAQARVDLVSAQLIGATNDVRARSLTLERLVGRTGMAPDRISASTGLPDMAAGVLNDWLTLGTTSQPAIHQAEKTLAVARLEVLKAEAAEKPTIDLTATYSHQQYPNGTVAFASTYQTHGPSIGLQFNMPLFAGFALRNRIKETLALEHKAQSDLETAIRSGQQLVQASYFEATSGREKAQALRTAEISTLKALEASQVGYRIGIRIIIDVLNAQSQLFQTRRDLAQARYAVLIAGLKLRQAAGVLSIQALANIDAWTR